MGKGMKTETWTCDWCGADLPGEPALQACIREPASGNFHLSHHACQGCLDKFITMLDPSGTERKAMNEKMGRQVYFRAFPGKLACTCKSAITCPHGNG